MLLNSSLHVLWSRGVDANDGHAPLVAWYIERCVEEAGVNCTVLNMYVSTFDASIALG